MSRPFYRRKRFWSALAAVAVLGFLLVFRHDIPEWLRQFRWTDFQEAVRASGAWAPVLCIVLLAVFTVAFLPTTVIVVLAGLLYNLPWAFAICWTGLGLGMVLAFLLSRGIMRGRIERRFGEHPLYLKIRKHFRRDGWKLIVFMRMLPVNPFPLLNYLFGLCPVSLPVYAACSLAGVVPNIAVQLMAARAAGEMAEGKLDWRVGVLLGGAAVLFLVVSFLPRLLRSRVPEACGTEE